MAEYIDRDKLIEQFICTGGQFVYAEYLAAIISRIKAQPAADVVEVVRCKDCLYVQEKYGHLECINGMSYRNSWNKPDDYCSYGKRKEGDGE